MSRASGSLALCVTAWVAACYSAPHPDCGFVCGPSGSCPAEYTCDAATNRCVLDGVDRSLCTGFPPQLIDAPNGVDVGMPDVGQPADADVTPPMLLSSMPAAGATGQPRTIPTRVVFTEPVTGVDGSTFTVQAGGNAIAGSLVAIDAITYEFTPSMAMPPNATITVTLAGTIADGSGNTLVPAPTTFSFET